MNAIDLMETYGHKERIYMSHTNRQQSHEPFALKCSALTWNRIFALARVEVVVDGYFLVRKDEVERYNGNDC